MLKRTERKKATITPLTIFVAYEGKKDEKKYFIKLKSSIPKRFRKLLNFIPVEKSTTNAAPQYVLDDLLARLDKDKVKIRQNSVEAYIVLDKDNNFEPRHSRNTWKVHKECNHRKINLLFSAPSFEVWLLLHHVNISTHSIAYQKK